MIAKNSLQVFRELSSDGTILDKRFNHSQSPRMRNYLNITRGFVAIVGGMVICLNIPDILGNLVSRNHIKNMVIDTNRSSTKE